MTREQRQRFLVTAAQVAPQYYPLFFTLTSMGMRVGEGLAWPRGRLGTPKAGHGRTVDVSQTLLGCLSHLPHRHPSGAGAGLGDCGTTNGLNSKNPKFMEGVRQVEQLDEKQLY